MTRVRGELRETKYVMEATRSKVSHLHDGTTQTSRGIIFTRLINLKSKLTVVFPKTHIHIIHCGSLKKGFAPKNVVSAR